MGLFTLISDSPECVLKSGDPHFRPPLEEGKWTKTHWLETFFKYTPIIPYSVAMLLSELVRHGPASFRCSRSMFRTRGFQFVATRMDEVS